MATMCVAQISRPNGPFEIVERRRPEPAAGTVRIKVEACGICHSDALTREGTYPGVQYPRVPGHEVAGVVDAVGPAVAGWEPGQRVGVGWNGGYCGSCDHCRRGEFFACVLGLGGLGHLGVPYAARMGFHTVGIARGRDKEPLARQLGASVYIDSQSLDPAAELLTLGGGLAVNGTLLIVGVAESMQVSPLLLLSGCRAVKGWDSGTAIDSQDKLAFSVRTGVRPMTETYPFERVSEAYDRMMSGKARFRVVLTIG